MSASDKDLPQNTGSGRRARRRGDGVERVALLGPGLLYAAALVAVPLVLLVVYAFLTAKRFGDVGRPFTTENVQRLTEPVYRSVVFTSVRLALIATLIALADRLPGGVRHHPVVRRWRTVALIAVVLPFWTNFLIRTYAWIVLLNNEGLINKLARSAGLVDTPVALMNNEPAIVLGLVYAYLPLMILPLVRGPRTARSRDRRSRRQPRRRRVHPFPHGDLSAHRPGRDHRVAVRVHPEPRQLRRPRTARRRQDEHARHARPRPVPESPELAVRIDDRPRRARSRRGHRDRPERRREALEREHEPWVCACTSPSSTASCSCRSPCSSCCRSTVPACRRRGVASPRSGTANWLATRRCARACATP